jgi:molybdenum cofactor cytidylyltransferase
MKVAAIILAAGRSSRFAGGPKLLADFRGKPLIHHVVHASDCPEIAEIILVTAPDGGKIIAAAGPGRWKPVANPNTTEGISSSIRAGLSALDDSIDGALIVLADMPDVTAGLIKRLCAAFTASNGTAIVFPQAPDGRQGNPVLWPRDLFQDLMKLSGDVGAKSMLVLHAERLRPVALDDAAGQADIDTRDDLARMTHGPR